jgi:hypothetical protein
MSETKRNQFLSSIIFVAASATIIGAALFLNAVPIAKAQATSVCHAAIVLDRSGSVGATNLDTMRQQILRLFQPTGLYNDRIQLAFWSFSDCAANTNYDAPFNGFVTSRGVDSNFQTHLNQMVSAGTTNYEQGFGYNNGILNSQGGMDAIINQADIIVFMTDGLPNTPASATNSGSGADNNAYARGVARTAVLKHKAAGTLIAGGMVGNASQGSLNFVINGSDNDATDTFRISTNYDDLATKLKEIIGQKCDVFTPPPPTPYSMTPVVSSNDNVVTGSDSATFRYQVNNATAQGNVSGDTNWTVKQVIVDRGQAPDPLYFGGSAYRDGYSCAQLLVLIGGRGSCNQVASGHKQFPAGSSSLDGEPGIPTSVDVGDLGVGTKICEVLTIDKPTDQATPVNRFSKAVCLIVGKRPSVQVYGGDVRVGRHFITDNGVTSGNPSMISTSTTVRHGLTYGSWAEYGAFASGPIIGFASMSGLQGGFASTLPNAQEFWSRLTFANANNQYGSFTPNDIGQGTIPDAKNAWLSGRSLARDLNGVNTISFNGDVTEGVYRKTNGNITLTASTIEKNKSIVLYAPGGTVTIQDNIGYVDGPYGDISEIPQLVIIAKNIVINANVVHISAWLISDDETSGQITTCENAATLTSQICNQPLRIDGPVMARHLILRRTCGNCSVQAADQAAEIINLTPDTFLWAQGQGKSEVRVQTTFTTEMPPYF